MSSPTSTCFGWAVMFNTDLGGDTNTRITGALSSRQLALLVSATNFHALDNPQAQFLVRVYLAKPGDPAHLTDASTRHEQVARDAAFVGEFSITSTVAGEVHPHYTHTHKDWVVDPETYTRHIVLDAERDPQNPSRGGRPNFYWWLRGRVERRFPFQYDRFRQWLLRGREASLNSHFIDRRIVDVSHVPSIVPGRGVEAIGVEPAVIFGLHWLELGGAERWAIESVAIARDHGFRTIVITDVSSHHSWITRPELADSIVLALTHPLEQPEHSEPLLEALAANFDVRGAFVHHSRWLYDRLPWLRQHVPGLQVATSHHILEYNGGGYPATGATLDEFIDVHHVISPQLVDWFVDVQKVDPATVALAPLVGMTTSGPVATVVKPRADPTVFTIGFIGRFAAQKRPYLFTKLVRTLRDDYGIELRVVIQGAGELEHFVRRDVARHKLASIVEWVDESSSVKKTLAGIDCLVLSSQNEGLTLTTLEALAAGVPVISTNVGSQKTVIVEDALVSREPHRFVTEAADLIVRMNGSEEFRAGVWQGEVDLAHEFTTLESAHDWAGKLFDQWKK